MFECLSLGHTQLKLFIYMKWHKGQQVQKRKQRCRMRHLITEENKEKLTTTTRQINIKHNNLTLPLKMERIDCMLQAWNI